MNSDPRWPLRLYRFLLKMYPTSFRDELGDEMVFAFSDVIGDASERGSLSLGIACFRELRDFPGLVLREHWLHIRNRLEELTMNEVIDFNGRMESTRPSLGLENQPETWREALMAGLPHLIITALLLVITFVTRGQEGAEFQKTFEIATLVFAWSMVATLLVMLIIAWRRGWPRWSASYYFYAFLGVAAPLIIAFQNRWFDRYLMMVYPLVLVVWIYIITRRDAIKGLLMITPIAILFWFPVLEFIPGEIRNPLQVGMFLVAALAAIAIARYGNWRAGIWIIIVSSMLVGVPIAYFRTYRHNIPPEYADPSTITMFAGRYAEALFWSAMLVIVPLLFWVLWELSRRGGGAGKVGYWLAFSGLLLNLGGNLFSNVNYAVGFIFLDRPLRELLFSTSILVSAAIYLIGIVLLLRAVRQEGVLTGSRTIALFIFVAIGLPLMFMFPMFDSRRYTPTRMPFGLFYENDVPDILVYGLGALWLFVGGWLVTRLRVGGSSTPGGMGTV